MTTIGCDLGSLYTKLVLLKERDLVSWKIVPTTGNIAQQIDGFLKELLSSAGMSFEQIDQISATGMGANLVKGAKVVDILTSLRQLVKLFPSPVEYLIDLGGQSITCLHLNPEGELIDFMRNDKCASGSGRFLELMSKKLEIGLEEIDRFVQRAKNPIELSNQCGVFAESEVISYINQGVEKAEIIAGVCSSVAKMVSAQARRLGVNGVFTITGGGAKINSLLEMIKAKVNGSFQPFPFNPHLAGAVGSALSGDSL